MDVIIGETVLLARKFHDPSTGAATDPTSPALYYRAPGGTWATATAPSKQNSRDGYFGTALDTTGFDAGPYAWEIEGTVGGVVQGGAGEFTVRAAGGGSGAPAIAVTGGVQPLRAGDTHRVTFATLAASGAAANADSLPTGAVKRNGVADGAVTVTVANDSTGQYSASYTIPTGYNNGDVIELVISATVGGVATKAPAPSAVVISKMAFDDTVTLGDNTRVLEIVGNELRERRYAPGDTPGTPSVQDSHVTDVFGNEVRNPRTYEIAARGVNEA